MLSIDDILKDLRIDTTSLRAALSLLTVALLSLPAFLLARNDCAPGNTPTTSPATRQEISQPAAGQKSRIVDLADVIGTVKVRRPGTTTDDAAAAGMPIQESFDLSSSTDSTAGIAFEDDSTAIIGPRSRVLFYQLALDPQGNRLTGVTIEHGLATIHFLPQHHAHAGKGRSEEAFEVHIGDAKVTTAGKCRFRVDIKGRYVRVEVFKGQLRFGTPFQSVEIVSGRSVEHKIGGTETAFDTRRHIEKDPWDGFASLEEQKVLSVPKSKKGRQPQDLNTMLRLRRMSPSSDDGVKNPLPPRGRY